ncbi:hypothetical protein [Romboutsia ilealis]|uniref:hypothetical protein n=1 Tax=Romboutsia ilealis TaxID=1115758 RepID=UPI00272CEA31|nr:hypothetical protein [Romboutsia ilealis]
MSKLELFQEDMNKVVYQLIDTHIKPLIDSKVLIKGKFEPPKEDVKEVFSKHFEFNTDDLGIQVVVFEDSINPIVCEYTYKGLVIDPVGYYVLDSEKRSVSHIEILEQCIIQDTHKPNIKAL